MGGNPGLSFYLSALCLWGVGCTHEDWRTILGVASFLPSLGSWVLKLGGEHFHSLSRGDAIAFNLGSRYVAQAGAQVILLSEPPKVLG